MPNVLFPALPVFVDSAPDAAPDKIRTRSLPVCFGIELPTLTDEQVKAIPAGWATIRNADGAIIGACSARVIYSEKRGAAVIAETFAITLTPEQELAAMEREAADTAAKQAQAIAAKRETVMDGVKRRTYDAMAEGAEKAAYAAEHAVALARTAPKA